MTSYWRIDAPIVVTDVATNQGPPFPEIRKLQVVGQECSHTLTIRLGNEQQPAGRRGY